jgi:hypothetical protein
MSKEIGVNKETVAQTDPFETSQIKENTGPIEQASESDINMEKFMNDILTVVITRTGQPGENPAPTFSCNGTNQTVIRGVKQKIKRKYVEVMARCQETNYEQIQSNPLKPESLVLVPSNSPIYPFQVLNDPHPDGHAWLENIMSQPV